MKTANYRRIERRKKRISANIIGAKDKPRIAIFRSNRFIYAQAIDDEKRNTIASYSSLQLSKEKEYIKKSKKEESLLIGIALAKQLLKLKITTGVFDRSQYQYNGRVSALATGLRKGGLHI
jgi:large subunit ribosomal protein L18